MAISAHFSATKEANALFQSAEKEFNSKLLAIGHGLEEHLKQLINLYPGARLERRILEWVSQQKRHKDVWIEIEYRSISIEGQSWFKDPAVIQTNPLKRHNDISAHAYVDVHALGKSGRPHKKPQEIDWHVFLSEWESGDIRPKAQQTSTFNIGLDILKSQDNGKSNI